MKNRILVIILFISIASFSQKKQTVEVTNTKTEDAIIVKAKNNNSTQYELTLTVNQKNLKGYKKPIIKLIPANSEIEIVKLFFIKGKKWSYNSKYTYKAKPTNEEIAARKQKLKEKVLAQTGDITKGIVVFSKDGCTRCHYVTSYMLDNNIDFKFLNTSENKNYSKLMWSILREKVPKAGLKSVLMPVVLVNGELSYNMKDLKVFVSALKN